MRTEQMEPRPIAPPEPRGAWSVSGAEPVRVNLQPAPWEPLVHGLVNRAAAESWLREHARDQARLVHFLVCDASIEPSAAKPHPELWETWERGPDGVVRSARDRRRLDGRLDAYEGEARRF